MSVFRSSDPLANPTALIERVYSYVAWRIGPGPDAEDITSDVLERALRYRHRYDSRKGDPAAWMIGIARRCVDDSFTNRQRPAPDEEIGGSWDGLADDAVDRMTLAAAVAALDERDRELVELRYGADLKARQIAEILGMSTNAVEVALHRALARLRATLEDEGRRPPEPAPRGKQPGFSNS